MIFFFKNMFLIKFQFFFIFSSDFFYDDFFFRVYFRSLGRYISIFVRLDP